MEDTTLKTRETIVKNIEDINKLINALRQYGNDAVSETLLDGMTDRLTTLSDVMSDFTKNTVDWKISDNTSVDWKISDNTSVDWKISDKTCDENNLEKTCECHRFDILNENGKVMLGLQAESRDHIEKIFEESFTGMDILREIDEYGRIIYENNELILKAQGVDGFDTTKDDNKNDVKNTIQENNKSNAIHSVNCENTLSKVVKLLDSLKNIRDSVSLDEPKMNPNVNSHNFNIEKLNILKENMDSCERLHPETYGNDVNDGEQTKITLSETL